MTIARSLVVSEGVEGLYHCVSRCVRRAFLCGRDPYTGRNFEHRKAWVRNRLKKLSLAFGVDVCAYAVMSNHLHVVLRTRPDRIEKWSDLETARRWLMIFSRQKDESGLPKQAGQGELGLLAKNKARIREIRARLGSVSWFMRCLNENIARRANREDDCKGRFWEGRFKCQALLDDSAVLACLAYVDLNPVRAGLAKTPEESEFTSVYDRIRDKASSGRADSASAAWLCPIGDEGEPGMRGLLQISLDEYLDLLDWTGRNLRAGSAGAIPSTLEPILTRLTVSPQNWSRTVTAYGTLFRRVAGRVESIRAAAERLGRRWFYGLSAGRRSFSPD